MEKYKNGYVNLPNRKDLFFYNKEWDSLFDLNIKDSKKFIVNYFRDFEGEYFIKQLCQFFNLSENNKNVEDPIKYKITKNLEYP